MILGNFLGIDPEYPGSGLGRSNQIQKEVWDEFAADPLRLRRVASAISAGADIPILQEPEQSPLDATEVFPEGLILTTLHLMRERNSKAVARKKQSVLATSGRLECEVCEFDFERVYGSLGHGFAECHHILPLSELPFRRETRLVDLVVVCSNCHRMLHRSRPVLDVGSLKQVVASLRAGSEIVGSPG
jgi:5-methylcytosine-specific restriction protein A